MNTPFVLALIIGVGILTVLIVVIATYIMNKQGEQRKKPDYRVFFILGISLLPVGIATDNPGLWGMGAIFLILGLANRSKWKAEPKWSELGPEKRKTIFLIILGLTVLLVLAGSIFYMLAR